MKTLIAVLTLLIFATNHYGKENVTIEHFVEEFTLVDDTPLNTQELENATVLGKVWGFLKYHHPEIASGKYDWDKELFVVMDSIIYAKNSAERDEKIVSWIDKYGAVNPCNTCEETKKDAVLKPDHRWMHENNISPTLTTQLQYIYKNRHQGKQHYIGYASSGVRNPKFKNEELYADTPFPDRKHRLLTVFRLWNSVHYFSPNKHITNKDWNTTLIEYINPMIHAADELAYEKATIKLIGELKDTHSNLWRGADKLNASRGTLFPLVHLQFLEGDVLVIDDFFNPEMQAESGLNLGDEITHIDGKKVSEIVATELEYYPASNRPTQLRDLAESILKSNTKTRTITIKNETESKEITINMCDKDKLSTYRWYKAPEGKSYKMLDHNIGYITLANITDKDPKNIEKEFIDAKGLIIDIRNYPSAFVPFSLGKFIAHKGTEFVKFTRMNLDNPGEFIFTEPKIILDRKKAKKKFEGPVIVIVNEISQSQAEYTAMAFRAAPNTTIIGSTTAGADGNVSGIKLPGNMVMAISGIGVYYPDGSPTQRVGIVPDIEVKPTLKGILEGRDELLEKAMALILKR